MLGYFGDQDRESTCKYDVLETRLRFKTRKKGTERKGAFSYFCPCWLGMGYGAAVSDVWRDASFCPSPCWSGQCSCKVVFSSIQHHAI
jgi:hypothetical protein